MTAPKRPRKPKAKAKPDPYRTTHGAPVSGKHRFIHCHGTDMLGQNVWQGDCSIGQAHYHCSECGLEAWPGACDWRDQSLSYLAYDDRETGEKEWERVKGRAAICPLPTELRPYIRRRVRAKAPKQQEPRKVRLSRRWTLWRAVSLVGYDVAIQRAAKQWGDAEYARARDRIAVGRELSDLMHVPVAKWRKATKKHAKECGSKKQPPMRMTYWPWKYLHIFVRVDRRDIPLLDEVVAVATRKKRAA